MLISQSILRCVVADSKCLFKCSASFLSQYFPYTNSMGEPVCCVCTRTCVCVVCLPACLGCWKYIEVGRGAWTQLRVLGSSGFAKGYQFYHQFTSLLNWKDPATNTNVLGSHFIWPMTNPGGSIYHKEYLIGR